MKARITFSFFFLITAITLFISCAASSTYMIIKPEILYRSPALDFTKVQAVVIMPVNSYESEVPEVSGAINDGLPIELKIAQQAWKVIAYDEVIRKMNEKGLGRGYQNYVADLNTFVQAAGGTPNFTAETYKFFEEMSNEMGFQAMIFTSYGYSEQVQGGEKLLFGALDLSTKTKKLSVTTILYDLSSRRALWLGRLSLEGGDKVSILELVKSVVQGISQNFGKGTLRQL